MEKLDLNKKLNIYFIGIGGVSMSAIAYILKKNGFIVSGSDFNENEEVKKLKNSGINVNIGHHKENIKDDIDVVVYSKAIHSDNEEIVEAKKKNIKLMSRSEILGKIMANYEKRLCIAGTHGKTTTTSMVAKVMLDSKIEPTINVGGNVDAFSGNTYIGDNLDMFIAEACEYTNSFLDFYPTSEIITNIECDHLDFFKDINDIRNSFKRYIDLLPDNSTLVIHNRIDNIKELVADKNIKIITYGIDDTADYYYKNAHYDSDNYQTFDVYHRGTCLGEMKLVMFGEHNIWNFLGALALLIDNGISFDDVKKSLIDFRGAHRRLEKKGVINGITFIDDYAHHPTEIEASINALKKLKYNKLYIIFQPHTFSRTKALLKDFARVLKNADNLILAKIYPAREIDDKTISANDILIEINKNISDKNNQNNIREYSDTFEKIIELVKTNAKAGDIVVTMGAGDVYKICDEFLKMNK